MTQKKVIVIGGGLAGLTAAYRIQTDLPELDVTVLEANAYPGGRMKSEEFGGEAGGEVIGSSYECVHNIAREVGAPIDSRLVNFSTFNIAYYLKSSKEWVQQKDWAKWKQNPLPSPLKEMSPLMLLNYFARKVPPPPIDKLFDDPKTKELAKQSLLDFLKSQKAPPESFPFIESNFEVNQDLSKISALSIIIKTWMTSPTPNPLYYFIHGGNQNLPKAIASKLKDVQYNQKVIAVERTKENRYKISTENGKSFDADYVVFSIPTGPMRKMKITPPLEGMQKEAFDKIAYTPSIKVFFKATAPFWEKDKLSIMMYTDTDINMVIPVYDIKTRTSPLSGPDVWGIYTISSGEQAAKLYAMQEKGIPIHEQCQKILEEIRPSTKGSLEYVMTADWGHIPTSMGAFPFYPPDPKIPDYYKNIAKPSLNRYFSGDHTESLRLGLNAAAYSGFRVAEQLGKDYIDKKVLIIGTGNLGLHLAKLWKKKFYQLRLTTTTPEKKNDLFAISEDVLVMKIEDSEESLRKLEEAIADQDVVVCLHGPFTGKRRSPAEMQAHYDETLRIPAKMIAKALSKKSSSKKPHVIFTSNINIYGTGEQAKEEIITEESIVVPESVYSEIEKIYAATGDHVSILRLGELYDYEKLAFIHKAKTALEQMGGITPFDPEAVFSRLHVEDAARAIDFVVENKKFGFFNVCEKKQETIKEFFDQLCTRYSLPFLNHMKMFKSSKKKISAEKIFSLGFQLTYPRLLFMGAGELAVYSIPYLKEDYHCTITTTSVEKLPLLKSQFPDADVAVLDGGDIESLKKITADKEAVIIAVAPSKKKFKSFSLNEDFYNVVADTYIKTTQNYARVWMNAIQKPKVVYISSHSVYPDLNNAWMDEKTYVLPSHQATSILKEAEEMIWKWIPESVVLRFGFLMSPKRNWKLYLNNWKKHLPNYELGGEGKGHATLLHIEDAARAISFSLKQNIQGIYNVNDDAHPYWEDLFNIAAEILGVEPPKWNKEIQNLWSEGNHLISNKKIKEAGFHFLYPREMGLSFLFESKT